MFALIPLEKSFDRRIDLRIIHVERVVLTQRMQINEYLRYRLNIFVFVMQSNEIASIAHEQTIIYGVSTRPKVIVGDVQIRLNGIRSEKTQSRVQRPAVERGEIPIVIVVEQTASTKEETLYVALKMKQRRRNGSVPGDRIKFFFEQRDVKEELHRLTSQGEIEDEIVDERRKVFRK